MLTSKYFQIGVVDTSKIAVLNETEIIVVNKGVYSPLKIDARDKYENHCELDFTVHTFEVHIKQVDMKILFFPYTSSQKIFKKSNVLV